MDWSESQRVPLQTANQFLAQIDAVAGEPDLLILAIGQAVPPPVLGTPEERAAALQRAGRLSVQTLGRYTLTPKRLAELIELLQRMQRLFQDAPVDRGEAAQ